MEAALQSLGAPTEEAPSSWELHRRGLALRQACSRLLALAPQQRPRSLQGLCRLLKTACTVRTRSISPRELAVELGLPAVTALAPEVTEAMPEATLSMVRKRWKALEARGWPEKAGPGEVARWVEGASVVEVKYAPVAVVDALVALGLVGEGCAKLTAAACEEVLRAAPAMPGAQHTIFKKVSVPPRCRSALIGLKGEAIAGMRCRLRAELQCTGVAGSLMLHVAEVSMTLRVTVKTEKRADCEACAELMEKRLRREVSTVYRERLRKQARMRAQLMTRRQELGRSYQLEQHFLRAQRRQMPPALRALELPDAGVDGFGSNFVGRRNACPGLRLMQKQAGLMRRRRWLRSKRRSLLRACAAARAQGLCLDADAWREPNKGTERMRACQALLAEEHLAGEKWLGVQGLRRAWQEARRVRRQVEAVAVTAGVLAPERARGPARPKEQEARKACRRTKANRKGVAAEIKEGLSW